MLVSSRPVKETGLKCNIDTQDNLASLKTI